jgi:5-(carboxyamino)imidazole ribonucleotide mutase
VLFVSILQIFRRENINNFPVEKSFLKIVKRICAVRIFVLTLHPVSRKTLHHRMSKVAIIMGSASDWDVMSPACSTLEEFGIPFEKRVLSAHRNPGPLADYVRAARDNGFDIIIAGAGGAAHLPGVIAALTTLPVIGVPVKSKALNGLDSLLSIVQMPSGIPVATMAIDGAKNAALYAVAILALQDTALRKKLEEFRQKQSDKVLSTVI